LQKLRALDKEIILFTNAHEDTVALKMQKTGLAQAFDQTITSHSLGHAKEVNQAWVVLGEQHDFDPARSLFIDDNFAVLDSARAYGIGYLLGIVQPDSEGEPLSHPDYSLLESFEQIMPV